jgi:hypothetical protein
MAKNKTKTRPKEKGGEPKHSAESKPLVADPPRPNAILLTTSSVLLAAWLVYLLYVAIRG